eukprot:gene8823-75_t
MMAAENGSHGPVDDLVDAGANWKQKCSEGLTAEDYAKRAGNDVIAAWFGRGCQSEECSEGEDDGFDGDANATEGESASQRRLGEKAAGSTRGRSALTSVKEQKKKEEESDEEEEEEGPEDNTPPIWDEVAAALADSHLVQVNIIQKPDTTTDLSIVDPALWRCKHINSLVLRLGPALTALPDKGPGRLVNLKTLILSGNALITLPASLCSLPLKVLEAEGNALTELPADFFKLQSLENLQLSRNKLTSDGVAMLKNCKSLVTLALDHNCLTDLGVLELDKMPRLNVLSVRSNKVEEIPDKLGACIALSDIALSGNRIEDDLLSCLTLLCPNLQVEEIPDELGACIALSEIALSGNQIEDVPVSLGNLKEKKVRVLDISGNPLADPKIRKMLDKSATFTKELLTYLSGNPLSDPKIRKMQDKSATFTKELLTYLRKGGGGRGKGGKGEKSSTTQLNSKKGGGGGGKGGKGKKGKKVKKAVTSSDEDESEAEAEEKVEEKEEEAAPPPPPAPVAAAPPAKKLSKKEMLKEKEKAERRAAEEAMKAKHLESSAKAQETEGKRLQMLEDSALGGGNDNDDDDDDEMGWEAPNKKSSGAGGGGGYMYSLSPEQLKEAEAVENARLKVVRMQKDEDEARAKMSKDQQEEEEEEEARVKMSKDQQEVGPLLSETFTVH